MNQLSVNENPGFSMTPPLETANYTAFPSLGGQQPASPVAESSLRNLYASRDTIAPPPGISTRPGLAPEFVPSRPQSRPTSRHQSPGPRSPSFTFTDPDEAFPSLAAAGLRGPRKHHGKRGHGHNHKDREGSTGSVTGSLADIVRQAPAPTLQSPRRTLRGRGSYTGTRENSTTAQAIPAPERIPWLETGDRANKAYLKARTEAIRHGGARNKFLQRYDTNFGFDITEAQANRYFQRRPSLAPQRRSCRENSLPPRSRRKHQDARVPSCRSYRPLRRPKQASAIFILFRHRALHRPARPTPRRSRQLSRQRCHRTALYFRHPAAGRKQPLSIPVRDRRDWTSLERWA